MSVYSRSVGMGCWCGVLVEVSTAGSLDGWEEWVGIRFLMPEDLLEPVRLCLGDEGASIV